MNVLRKYVKGQIDEFQRTFILPIDNANENVVNIYIL